MEKILTVNDVADVLQVKAITVREMFREKRLRGFKVGKAWRTTEVLLQEDIDALARGEAPAELPVPEPQNAKPDVAPVNKPVASSAKQKAAPQESSCEEAVPPAPKASPPSPKNTPDKSKTSADPAPDDDDDTQQMLF